MLDFGGLLGLVLLGLWIFCIFDVIASDTAEVRNLPKLVWLLLVLLIPDIGAVAWLILGRPESSRASARPARPRPAPPARRARPPARRAARPPRREDESDIQAAIDRRDRQLAAWAEEERARQQAGEAKPEDAPEPRAGD